VELADFEEHERVVAAATGSSAALRASLGDMDEDRALTAVGART
jgi:hypothetical protein